MWGVHITNLSIYMSIQASHFTSGRELAGFPTKAVANLLMGIAETINVIVTVVSYVIIIPATVKQSNAWDTPEHIFDTIFNKILVHTLPIIFSTVNLFMLTDTIMYYTDLWFVPLMTAAYMGMAYTYTKTYNSYIYPFMTFKDGDIFSTIFEIATPIAGILVELLLAFITQQVRGRNEFTLPFFTKLIQLPTKFLNK